ncbi:hypothetical protein BN938_1712 [Mucinivorans hirudinis]|uniref:Uncharacterized protein n=1 Tax=Mucinivorans hirudinis TaxID=1433126 RepID=A0A060R8J5_9BACT|nr:hypothetical protein BN938_1712 [Mucinivorans hirudinis]
MRKIFIALLCLCLFNHIFAKSLKHGQSGGHEADIYSVLPFDRDGKIDALILAIHNNIDLPIGYFNGLRDEPHHQFTWHKYGHRTFFHWGFNSNPKSSKILQELVEERQWTPDVVNAFWDKVIAEQARRNRLTMENVGKTLNFGVSGAERSYSNAFASIITDIHILGDYSTTNIAMLQSLDLVVADIEKALFESLKGGAEAKRINKLLNDTKSIQSERDRAAEILLILQKELPKFILTVQDGFFKRHFSKLGYSLRKV